MTQQPLPHVDPESFRTYGKEVVDWIADYLKHPEDYPVLAQVKPGDIKQQLPAAPPAAPEAMDTILADFHRIIMPGITHWNHPSFFAYFANSASAPGMLGEMLCTALNINGMLWRTSPSATELEEVVLTWLRQMIGLPESFRGVITDTASVSTLVALTAAREATQKRIREDGLAGRTELPKLRMYISDQTHSSGEKAGIVLGIGQNNVVKIPSDKFFRMDVTKLEQAIADDKKNGYLPFAVMATIGTTATTSIDPVPEIATICKRENIWLHVDGAYGGSWAVMPEMKHILAGCEFADSMVVNPHKSLLTPMDCSVLYTRHVDTLQRAFSLVPEYLKTSDGDATNYMDWGVQLGRRFRALKLWFIIRSYGVDGIAAKQREQCRLAKEFASWLEADGNYERIAPVNFSVVCFRFHPKNISDEAVLEKLNANIINSINATGEAFLAGTKLNGRFVIRLAIGNVATSEQHIQRVWELVQQYAVLE
jgi:aromatic-L-amino-acid decarboxylase